MNPEQAIAKLMQDMQEFLAGASQNQEALMPLVMPVISLFTELGFFEQLETGDSNSVTWLFKTLVENQEQLTSQNEVIRLLKVKFDNDSELSEAISSL